MDLIREQPPQPWCLQTHGQTRGTVPPHQTLPHSSATQPPEQRKLHRRNSQRSRMHIQPCRQSRAENGERRISTHT